MKKIFSIGIVLAVIFSFSFIEKTDTSQPGKWVVLGKKVVNMKADHDEIVVTAARGTFKRLKFKVLHAPIFVNNIKVIYGNGSSENFVIKRKFIAGHESKVVDLKGHDRIIKKININYKTVPVGKGKAEVIVFGKH